MEPAKIDPFHLLETAKRLQFQTSTAHPALPTGISALDSALPDSGFPRGQVIELVATPGAGLGTSLALAACRAAQREAAAQGQTSWCAFVDPSASLYAPAVLEKGIDLKHLLVVRPPLEALTRVVLRLTEAKTFSVIVVDTMGHIGESEISQSSHARSRVSQIKSGENNSPGSSLQQWVRTIRRLSMAIEGSHTQVILLTNQHTRRSLPLPVGLRLELGRKTVNQLAVKISKEKRGRISETQLIALPKDTGAEPVRLLRRPAQEHSSQTSEVTEASHLSPRLSLVPPVSSEMSEGQVPLFPEHLLGKVSRASR